MRQLRATVESAGALIMPDSELVDVDLLKFASGESMSLPEISAAIAPVSTEAGALDEAIAELETRMIRDAMEQAGSNQSEAARRLGISRAGLIKSLRGWGSRPELTALQQCFCRCCLEVVAGAVLVRASPFVCAWSRRRCTAAWHGC